MKIGIFGNTNNYPLLLAGGLRQLGHEVALVVNRKERLHRPESKFPELEHGYPPWILDCSDLPEEDFIAGSPRIGEVLNFLAGTSDGLLLNHLGPSLLEFCPLPAVAIMTGSDVTYYANPRSGETRLRDCSDAYRDSPGGRLGAATWLEFVSRQRRGILAANKVSAAFPGLVPQIDDILADIGVTAAQRDFIYLAETDVAPVARNRANGRLRVVNGARLNWKKPLPAGFCSIDHKGTDILLEGFARFVSAGGDAELVMFRKGLHVPDTERLVDALDLAGHVTWRDELSLKDFSAELASADIVCDQVGDSFPGMVALDAMALGVPVIANFRPDLLERCYREPMTGCQASSPEEVALHLAALAGSPRTRASAGRAARAFARKHLSPAANAGRCLQHLALQ